MTEDAPYASVTYSIPALSAGLALDMAFLRLNEQTHDEHRGWMKQAQVWGPFPRTMREDAITHICNSTDPLPAHVCPACFIERHPQADVFDVNLQWYTGVPD